MALWRDFPERLQQATGCGVIVYSRAGYGQSDTCALPRPLDYMTDEAVRVLPQVLTATGARRFVTIGHSDGATIAAIHAGLVRDPRLAGTVLIAPHFFTEPEQLTAIEAAKAAYDTGQLKAKLSRYHRHVEAAFRGWNDTWLAPGFRDWNVTDVLDDIAVPILAMQGDADPYGSLSQIDVIETRSLGPVERIVLPGVGHAPHAEVPEEASRLVADWVRSICKTAL